MIAVERERHAVVEILKTKLASQQRAATQAAQAQAQEAPTTAQDHSPATPTQPQASQAETPPVASSGTDTD
jgi:hypothetical protein